MSAIEGDFPIVAQQPHSAVFIADNKVAVLRPQAVPCLYRYDLLDLSKYIVHDLTGIYTL